MRGCSYGTTLRSARSAFIVGLWLGAVTSAISLIYILVARDWDRLIVVPIIFALPALALGLLGLFSAAFRVHIDDSGRLRYVFLGFVELGSANVADFTHNQDKVLFFRDGKRISIHILHLYEFRRLIRDLKSVAQDSGPEATTPPLPAPNKGAASVNNVN